MKYFKLLTILLVVGALSIFLTGCREEKELETKPANEPEIAEEFSKSTGTIADESEIELETTKLTLYFSDEQAMYLLPETREVLKTETLAEAAIEELIKGSEEAGYVSTIPEGTKLNGINIEDETAYVNFSEEFKANYQLGSAAENMTVYSIVNTLTELPTIKRVRFLVNGEPLEIVGSNFNFKTQEFSRNADLIK